MISMVYKKEFYKTWVLKRLNNKGSYGHLKMAYIKPPFLIFNKFTEFLQLLNSTFFISHHLAF